MTLNISFYLNDGAYQDERFVEIENVRSITTQDYVFNGRLGPITALVVDGTAYELCLVSDIRLSVHKATE